MKLPKKRTAITLLALLAIAIYLHRLVFLPLRSSVDPEIVETLENARSVEVFRVASMPSGEASDAIASFPILAKGKTQGPEFAKRLSEILLSNGVCRNLNKCKMVPGVAFRVSDGTHVADVLVCFECDNLVCIQKGGNLNSAEYQDFGSVRAPLLALTRDSLPDDEDIRNLAAQREE
jgi:hypothetical protein